MNLKLNENKKAIFMCNGKEHVIINAEIIGNYIDVKSEDGTLLTIYNNKENIKILNETNPEVFI